MKTRLLAAGLVLSVLGCIVLAYLWIDRSISLAYTSASADSNAAAVTNLERLLESSWNDMPKSTVLAMLQSAAARHPDDILVKEEEGAVWFDSTRFVFEEDRLKRVGGN